MDLPGPTRSSLDWWVRIAWLLRLFSRGSLPVRTVPPGCLPIQQSAIVTPYPVKTLALYKDPAFNGIIEGTRSGYSTALIVFNHLTRDVERFSDEGVDCFLQGLSLPDAQDPPFVTSKNIGRGTFIKLGTSFTSIEDYAYFHLVSIINHHLHEALFDPFHPCLSSSDNGTLQDEYDRLVKSNHQLTVGKWRSQKFRSLEAVISEDRKVELMRRILRSIEDDWIAALSVIVDQRDIPCLSDEVLTTLLQQAYDWNCIIKGEITQYNFEPFTMMPGTTWDPVSMQVFERLRGPVHPASTIVSVVSLGIRATVALGGSQDSQVQREIRVLVDEWLHEAKAPKNPLGDTFAEVNTPDSVSQAPSPTKYAPLSPLTTSHITRIRTSKGFWSLLARRATRLIQWMLDFLCHWVHVG
ncbi:hypothetical protein DL93DRAFT_2091180 [Clavulina sp. PMI_390]|nr:hypothetical protein DL93DRAFT_2091180 [Clavulina sp. PMI_390]